MILVIIANLKLDHFIQIPLTARSVLVPACLNEHLGIPYSETAVLQLLLELERLRMLVINDREVFLLDSVLKKGLHILSYPYNEGS